MQLNTIEEIIDDIRQGRMVILMDDEDRENEGDLIMASSMIRPDDINFMARYGRGLICLTLTQERCQQLNLPLMVGVGDNSDIHGTNFTLSIEAAEGVTTGISAYDRAMTVRAAVAPNAAPKDIVQPGHIFPLMAKRGGVLNRAGHTEAGCDLARIAGLEPSSVIVEILNEDGSMARRPDLEKFAEEHGLKIGTVADLIEYRLQNEPTVERVSECEMPTEHGDFRMFAYRDLLNHQAHFALVKGDVSDGEPVMVRVHLQQTLCDIFGNRRSDCGWPLTDVMRKIEKEGRGIVVILHQSEDSEALIEQVKRYESLDKNEEQVQKEHKDDLHTYGIGAQILLDQGVKHMKVMSAPVKLHALSGFGLDVVEYVN
ncbi:MAG: bifunctional 3,4-dihydroxy-2-butanone-4-phosphate synthase/GTP cyclohydrolase II [Gammaproteobacteria bacterium]|nr:bifunctional 3,4-dihydroxy-2-butanone-4-phosphate synthase/GTP cyclohydrolase II [Gammaproteobacteria bacterium]